MYKTDRERRVTFHMIAESKKREEAWGDLFEELMLKSQGSEAREDSCLPGVYQKGGFSQSYHIKDTQELPLRIVWKLPGIRKCPLEEGGGHTSFPTSTAPFPGSLLRTFIMLMCTLTPLEGAFFLCSILDL